MERTAAILTIGSEILSGKVTDDNSPYLCRELRILGVDVQRLAVVPDEEEVIAQHIQSWTGQYDFLFTCGGVGPTHDDVTIAGIAKGLGKRIIRNETLLDLIQKLYPPPLTAAILKLTEVPEGAALITAEGLRYPVVTVSNIYIFPGVPEILRKKFSAIKERFRATPYFIKKIYVKAPELEIAHHLTTVHAMYPDMRFGSYPAFKHPEYEVMLTLESKDPTYLDQAFFYLLSLLPSEIVLKIEST